METTFLTYLFILKPLIVVYALQNVCKLLLFHKLAIWCETSILRKIPNHVSHSQKNFQKASRSNFKQPFELGFIRLVCLCQVLRLGFRVYCVCVCNCQSVHKYHSFNTEKLPLLQKASKRRWMHYTKTYTRLPRWNDGVHKRIHVHTRTCTCTHLRV